MHFRWIATALLVILLTTCPVDAQKRRKGDKKKEAEAAKPESKPEGGGGGGRRGRQTTTTTTTTTTTLATTTVVDEEVDEEIVIVNEPRTAGNVCPPELKHRDGVVLPCTCRDELDDNALMIECVALTSGQQLHKIFNVRSTLKVHLFDYTTFNSFVRIIYSARGSMPSKFVTRLLDHLSLV